MGNEAADRHPIGAYDYYSILEYIAWNKYKKSLAPEFDKCSAEWGSIRPPVTPLRVSFEVKLGDQSYNISYTLPNTGHTSFGISNIAECDRWNSERAEKYVGCRCDEDVTGADWNHSANYWSRRR